MLLALAWISCTSTPPPPAPPAVPTPPAPAEAPPSPATPRLVRPADVRSDWVDARCNDGTPFAYTVREGTEPTWVINLSGGFYCNDLGSPCSERKRRLTTTLPDTPGAPRARRGVLDPDPARNPTFAGAHHVEAHYCSSDFWLGGSTERQPTSGDPQQGWYFSGRRNLAVLLASLASQGLDEADPGTRVLLLGTSAGGIGLVGNLDTIAAAFPNALPQGRLKVLLDGAWLPEQPPEATLPDAARWGHHLPPCAEALTARGENPTRCVYGEVWWPFAQELGLPVLVQLSALDRTQTPVFGVDTPEARKAWRARTRASLGALPWAFSGGHAYHLVATEPLFHKGEPGATLQDLLDRFWAGGEPEQIFFGYDE